MTMQSHPLALLALTLLSACADPVRLVGGDGGTPVDVSLPGAQTSCGSTHDAIGRSLTLMTRAHAVAGTARIVDDCTIEIEGFSYDGRGLEVRVYGGNAGAYENGVSLSVDLLGTAFQDVTAIVRLPTGVNLDDFDGLSVWCVAADASFGDGTFE